MHLVETRDLCYTYPGNVTALHSINFIAPRKARIAVIGSNGAGKSTLFKHFNGIFKPTSGSVLVQGEPITKENIRNVRKFVGLVFQNPDDQIFSPTVEQDVAFGPTNLGLDEETVQHRVREALRIVGIEHLANRVPHHLSGGEKKRVAIAGVIAMEPQVLVLDEPTAGLDPEGVRDFNNFCNSLSSKYGLTVIFSFFTIEEEHNYGSIIVGLSLITLYCELFSQNIGQVKFLLPVMEVIIIWGMFAHWVNSLHHKAHYDPLLKIYNRQYMDNIISGIADIKLGKKLSVMMCDIDHFKKVNDTYGHAAGDAVLFSVAQTIRDTALPEGVVCRYGGEEIIVFLRDKIEKDAKAKAEKIRKAIKAGTVRYRRKNIKVTMSIGVASTKNGLEDIGKVIKNADDCVYKAKKSGRDKVVLD